jgi:hypothetical protein
MTNYKDYIGKTFKGFKFEHKKHCLGYYSNMNLFIDVELKITDYEKSTNSFITNSNFYYPADLVIAQLEKQTFKPKRGDKVLVWDDNEDMLAVERIFLTEIEGSTYPYICVDQDCEEDFTNGKTFHNTSWINMKPLPEKEIAKDTFVWVRQHEQNEWYQRFYSHFEDGKHYCFDNQKKSNETENTTCWNIVTTENPFE